MEWDQTQSGAGGGVTGYTTTTQPQEQATQEQQQATQPEPTAPASTDETAYTSQPVQAAAANEGPEVTLEDRVQDLELALSASDFDEDHRVHDARARVKARAYEALEAMG